MTDISVERLGNPTGQAPVLGEVRQPHQDGEFVTTVYDLVNWSTDSCLVRQTGQYQVHDQSYTKAEARALAKILQEFADS